MKRYLENGWQGYDGTDSAGGFSHYGYYAAVRGWLSIKQKH